MGEQVREQVEWRRGGNVFRAHPNGHVAVTVPLGAAVSAFDGTESTAHATLPEHVRREVVAMWAERPDREAQIERAAEARWNCGRTSLFWAEVKDNDLYRERVAVEREDAAAVVDALAGAAPEGLQRTGALKYAINVLESQIVRNPAPTVVAAVREHIDCLRRIDASTGEPDATRVDDGATEAKSSAGKLDASTGKRPEHLPGNPRQAWACAGCGHPFPLDSMPSRCPSCDESCGVKRRWMTNDEVKSAAPRVSAGERDVSPPDDLDAIRRDAIRRVLADPDAAIRALPEAEQESYRAARDSIIAARGGPQPASPPEPPSLTTGEARRVAEGRLGWLPEGDRLRVVDTVWRGLWREGIFSDRQGEGEPGMSYENLRESRDRWKRSAMALEAVGQAIHDALPADVPGEETLEMVQALVNQRDEARAEIERLTEQMESHVMLDQEDYAALHADRQELQRLRAAIDAALATTWQESDVGWGDGEDVLHGDRLTALAALVPHWREWGDQAWGQAVQSEEKLREARAELYDCREKLYVTERGRDDARAKADSLSREVWRLIDQRSAWQTIAYRLRAAKPLSTDLLRDPPDWLIWRFSGWFDRYEHPVGRTHNFIAALVDLLNAHQGEARDV